MRCFCDEQRLFAGDDRDALDDEALPIVAVSLVAGMSDGVVGTVRVHESSPGRWTGSRLAIRADCRGVHGLGSALVHRAVGTANARGCSEFLATVQRPNVAFFRRLGWHVTGDVDLHGMPHTTMRADLARFPACDADGETLMRARAS